MRITSSGNVGIGTTSPSSYGGAVKLAVASSSNTSLTIASGTSSDGTILFADGTSGDATYRGQLKYSHSNDAMLFNTAATERMRIDRLGTLTVGPQYDRLNVNPGSGSYDGDGTSVVIDGRTNDGNATAFKIDRYDSSGSASTKFSINYAGQVGIGTATPDALLDVENSSGAAEVQIKSLNASDCTLAFGDNVDTDVGRIRYAHGANAMLFFTEANERLRIDNSGNCLLYTSPSPRDEL